MSDAEVEAAYDNAAQHTSVGVNFWADELERRARERLMRSNARLAWLSLGVSIVGVIASIAAVVLSIVTLGATG